MKFYSTKNKSLKKSFREATLIGLPSDNGLFMPEYMPNHTKLVKGIKNLSLHDISYLIAESFMNEDLSNGNIEDIINDAITFSAPVVDLRKNKYILELFHGPTLAFKDFGACFMGRTMEKFVANSDKQLNILVATSGDTGSAVANGFYEVEGINVIILYPSGKISSIQEKQIATLDKNIYSLEVEGTFDDCQKLVKKAFLDENINSSISLSSANSINISRLIPQTFYYFYAYSQININQDVVFSVPSGNFGNLTAGIFSKYMGLPIKKFIASTNSNDVVPKFIKTGNYYPKSSVETISNAMDVGNPSNLQRILDLYEDVYRIRKDICSWSFSDNETKEEIINLYKNYKYLLDPHSAVGLLGLKKYLKSVSEDNIGIFLGTAHPSKFSDIIKPIINEDIKIPSRLKKMIDKNKRSIKIKNSFDEFSDYLLSNFK